MKNIILIVLSAFSLRPIAAQITYSEHIAPIIYENCTSCHREGEIGPFPLTNYDEVASWRGMVKFVTEIKYMPPWKPDPSYSHFVGENVLTDAEIELIANWVDAGAPQGDPALEPALPTFPSGSQLGEPDLVLEMAETYTIEGNNEDDYRVFVLPTELIEDKEIAAVEFRPGNTKAVHHVLLAYETAGAGRAKDAESEAFGYESFGDWGVPVEGTFTGYTPGIKNVFYPEGIGVTLPANADILAQVHYAPLPSDETDQSSINIFFKESLDPVERQIQNRRVTPLDLPGGFFSFLIPPNEITTFKSEIEITEDISLISIYPHCHYLGKNWEIYAVTPQQDTIHLIRINDWDFNWQGAYTFDRMKKIPVGTVIHTSASYDNTLDNPYNPSNPPTRSMWGEGTTDEMYLVGITFVPYQSGDENIILDSDLLTNSNDVVKEKWHSSVQSLS